MSVTQLPKDLPPIGKELIEAIEKFNPVKLPEPTDSDRDVWMHVGEQRFIRKLRGIHDRQQREDADKRNKHVLR